MSSNHLESPEAGQLRDSIAKPTSVNTEGRPCPEQAGQSPSVSLEPLVRTLNSEHPFLPNTKNIIKFIHHKGEALVTMVKFPALRPTLVLSLNLLLHLLRVHLILAPSRPGTVGSLR